MILDALGLIAFVICCMVLGYTIIKLKHARYARAWRPLAPVIGGTVRREPNGGDTTWLIGTWKGNQIHARMTPQVRDPDSDVYQSFFAVGVVELEGAASWDATSGLTSDDSEIRRRLDDAGVVERIQAVGYYGVKFDHRARSLFIEQNMHPAWCPRREQFVVLLDLATDLATINAQVNRL